VAVLHGGVPDDAQRLVERMEREYAPTEVLTNITGPVLGVHTGPGAISLCGYTED
jgi:fatty acid-binding protein DegV